MPDSQVKITGELPYAELQSERKSAIVALGKNIELDGFRRGHIPTPVLEKHLGEMTIMGEMAERAIAHSYPHIIEEHEIEAIGQPQIEVTKIAPGNPLAFNITVAVMPKFSLPDYNQIAKEINIGRPKDEVTDEELTEKIKEIQTRKRAYEKMQNLASENTKKVESADDTADPSDPSKIDTKGKAENPSQSENTKEVDGKEAPLPELTDEYVKTLGQEGQFENVEDFKNKLREHLEIEKKQNNIAQHRANITDSIIAKTEMTLPKILIDSEINQMFAQMEDDIKRADLKMDDYLKHIKKSKEELAEEWKPAAVKRAQLQLILNEIAKKEEIHPDVEKVNEQTKELMKRFKDADEHRVRLYVTSVLLNEEVMKFLEEK